MTTILNFGRDVQGFNAYAPQFATNAFSVTIVANTVKTLTVPSNFENWIAVFSFTPGSTVWVAVNATAAKPAGSSFASTTSELNPGARTVKGGDVISVITDTSGGCDIGVILYAIS